MIKTITCECGIQVSGRTDMEVIRKEMDHLRLYHPERYDEMLDDLSIWQLLSWMVAQIKRRSIQAM